MFPASGLHFPLMPSRLLCFARLPATAMSTPLPTFSRSVRSLPAFAAAALALLALHSAAPAATASPRTWVVAQADPAASDDGPGDAGHPFRSIAPAAAAAQPGDTVLVHTGIYRERVSPARGGTAGHPIVYAAAPGESVVVTGADLWTPAWEIDPVDASIRDALLDLPATGSRNPFRTPSLTLPGRTLGQVFVDDQPLAETSDRDQMRRLPGAWWFDPATSRLHLHLTPRAAAAPAPRVEITTRDRLFAPHTRGLGFITVRGFTFTRAANQFPLRFWLADDPVNSCPQAGAVGTRSGHDWIIEDNIIRDAANIGLDCGDEGGRDIEGSQPKPTGIGHHLIRRNLIQDNGASGIMGLGSHGSRILDNVIERNNRGGNTAPECAGIKLHDFVDGEIAGNLVRDNDCAGIWLDNVYRHARVSRNLVVANEDMGIFLELGSGPALVDDNIVAFTRGDGLYLHDASGVTAAHNLFFGNAHFGVFAHIISNREVRLADGTRHLVEASRLRVVANVFIDNFGGCISLPPESPRATDNRSDHNLFLTGTQGIWENERFTAFRLNTNNGAAATVTRDLSLDDWRAATHWDLASKSLVIADRKRPDYLKGAGPEKSARLAAHGDFFDLLDGAPLLDLTVPATPGVGIDYLGSPVPAESAHPGPFQQVTTGPNHLTLWPHPAAD